MQRGKRDPCEIVKNPNPITVGSHFLSFNMPPRLQEVAQNSTALPRAGVPRRASYNLPIPNQPQQQVLSFV
ncbi:hypothetical protein BDZ97DRAFT_1866224 [Flammula alnicola]|nr:hypothetical protein BDZ97DRAFT_1866224 [Flammula alnicola]